MSVLERDHVNPPMPGRRSSVTVPEGARLGSVDGIRVSLINYGASIASVIVPARTGDVDHPQFPNTLLRAGDDYRQHSSCRFEQIV